MHRLVATLAAAAVLFVGCSDDTDVAAPTTTAEAAPTTSAAPPPTSAAPTTTTSTAPDLAASAGCGAGTTAGSEGLTLDTTDGRTREYRRHVPTGYDDATPTPLVLNFHGLTSNIDAQVSLSRLEPLADTETFIVITPQGTLRNGEVPFWNASSVTEGVVNDTQFVVELLDRLEADLCVDTSRVYSTGMSNGGFMSSHLACVLPDRIAAIASVTGITWPRDCAADRAVPVVHFHGTADGIVEFDDVPDRIAEWATRNGCDTDPVVTEVSDEVGHTVFDCPDTAEVELYVVDGGGHTWPGTELSPGLAAILGVTTLDIDATALGWEFFTRHQLG